MGSESGIRDPTLQTYPISNFIVEFSDMYQNLVKFGDLFVTTVHPAYKTSCGAFMQTVHVHFKLTAVLVPLLADLRNIMSCPVLLSQMYTYDNLAQTHEQHFPISSMF